jgi:CitMHS family citrate-Mg2+:H+ or citrate-Ca2+:H+ symporter
MNLALLGFLMVISFMTLIMTKRLSAVTALILVPILFGLAAGVGPDLGGMIVKGVTQLAPTALMLAFAVLYFGIMIDAGLFDPLVRKVLATVGDDPVRVTVGTALLAMVVSLDGDGTTTALVTVSALLPVYRRLRLNPVILALLLGLSNTIVNLTPWGGPTARAATALHLEPSAVFLPLIPAMLVGLAGVLLLAWWLGLGERKRLGRLTLDPVSTQSAADPRLDLSEDPTIKRPKLIWFNLGLTLVLVAGLVSGLAPLPVLMMGAFAIAAIVNYPDIASQRKRVAAHANNVLGVVLLIFAAGAFTGILSGTGMVKAMADATLVAIPPSLGPYLAPITALISMPMTFFMSNDAFYFGVLPVIAETAAKFGVPAEAIARASLIGQPVHGLSPLIAAIYLVTGLLKVEVGEAQRFSLKWAVAACLLLLVAALATGAFPLRAG